jgi:hypothetical protein
VGDAAGTDHALCASVYRNHVHALMRDRPTFSIWRYGLIFLMALALLTIGFIFVGAFMDLWTSPARPTSNLTFTDGTVAFLD